VCIMSIVVLKSNMTGVTNLDTVTDTPLIKKVGAGPDTAMYPNSGPAPQGVTMPFAGGYKDSQSIRTTNTPSGRSADLPMGNGPVAGK
jgi:hypothetical protein